VGRIIAWSLFAVLALSACDGADVTPSPTSARATAPNASPEAAATDRAAAAERRDPVRLVTLGDAYTAGFATELPRRDSWPAQVVQSFKRNEIEADLYNLAVISSSSTQVLEEQLREVAPYKPDLVTVQVGINDLIYGETEWYRANLVQILDGLLEVVPAERIFAVTTPRVLTRAAGVYGQQTDIHAGIAWLNSTMAEVATERGIMVVDISLIDTLGDGDDSLTVEDGPFSYPTAKQYAGWAEVIGPLLFESLAADDT
jgi:lysophospholipase L1-like esterase